MEEKKYKSAQGRKYTDNFNKKSFMRKPTFMELNRNKDKDKDKDNDDQDIKHSLNVNKTKMRSDKKLINLNEIIPKILEQIKIKDSSNHNIDNLNHSFGHDSNSSEINDESDDNCCLNKKSNNNSPKKIPKLSIRNEEVNEYKNLEVPITYRPKRKTEKSPNIRPRKYSKENKDSLVLKLHKYFFQDGELENIDTLIKYNLSKIIINNNEENSNNNFIMNNDVDYSNIKETVINLMNKFATAFDNENKNQLITALKGLNDFSIKYKFDYVTNLTLEWLNKLNEKKYNKCEFKYIGYYNQIRDIMDKMLKEIKKKVDYIIMLELKKSKIYKNENNINNNNIANDNNLNNINSSKIIKEPPTMIINKTFQKKVSLNKEDLLKTKEIVPIKIDIEVQNTLNINEVENILKNLEEGALGNIGNKGNVTNNKKLLNKPGNRNDNELEAFSYPFKDDSMCVIF